MKQVRSCSLLVALVVLCCPPEVSRAQTGSRRHLQSLQVQRQQRQAKFQDALEAIARFCDEHRFADTAAEIRRLAMPFDINDLQLNSLPRRVQAKIPVGLPEDERQWRSQLRFERVQYARDLYLLSRRALQVGFSSYAYGLVREVALYDPDNKAARRLLGYERVGEEWMTPFAASMVRRRHQWHDKFGWLPNGHRDEYEQGQRYYKRRWISAARDAELRRDFRNAWQIRTDHYLIKTNYSLESAVQLGTALEDFHGFFLQTFAAFFNTPEQLRRLFEGRTSRGSRKMTRPYVVHYYRTRDEYIRRLRSKIDHIEITNGLYLPDDRVAYFYHNPDEDKEATLYHEATHQLFYENLPRNRRIAANQDFWIVEGIACYMESFRRDNGRFAVGNPNYIRFQAARYRFLIDEYFLPLAQLTRMGMREFQNHPDIRKNYSQASGLAHFFMHYKEGRYRDALIEHLSQMYNSGSQSNRTIQSLAALCGLSFRELDKQYGEHLKAMEQPVTEGSAQGN